MNPVCCTGMSQFLALVRHSKIADGLPLRPIATSAGLKCRSAAVSCRTEVCYPFCRKHGRHQAVKRREFITLLGGAAATWPLAARAQQAERMRRVGVLMPFSAGDPEVEARKPAFEETLRHLGWTVGANLLIEYRLPGSDAESLRRHVAELVALTPDVIVTAGALAPTPVLQATRTIPIVMANVPDPVG